MAFCWKTVVLVLGREWLKKCLEMHQIGFFSFYSSIKESGVIGLYWDDLFTVF